MADILEKKTYLDELFKLKQIINEPEVNRSIQQYNDSIENILKNIGLIERKGEVQPAVMDKIREHFLSSTPEIEQTQDPIIKTFTEFDNALDKLKKNSESQQAVGLARLEDKDVEKIREIKRIIEMILLENKEFSFDITSENPFNEFAVFILKKLVQFFELIQRKEDESESLSSLEVFEKVINRIKLHKNDKIINSVLEYFLAFDGSIDKEQAIKIFVDRYIEISERPHLLETWRKKEIRTYTTEHIETRDKLL